MNELIVAKVLCEHCGQEIPPGTDQCPECEVCRVPVVAAPQVPMPAQPAPTYSLPPSLEHRWVVLAILLFTGPIGLPLVWLNRRFSKAAKIILTTGFLLFTVVFPIALVWYWCELSVRPIVQALGQ